MKNFKNLFSAVVFLLTAIIVVMIRTFSGDSPPGIEEIIYLMVFITGVWFTRKLLLDYFSDSVTAISVVAIIFGSNLLHLTSGELHWQAILLFTLYAILLQQLGSWHFNGRLISLIVTAIATGMIIVIQPTGYLIIFIVIFWGIDDRSALAETFTGIFIKWKNILLFTGIMAATIILSLLFFADAPGEIPYLSISLPGLFIFGSRFLINMLADPSHGLLIFTPLIIIAFAGFYFLAEKESSLFFPLFIFFLFDLLAESCWDKLYLKDVYGQLGYVPLWAIVILPLGFFVEWISEGKMFLKIISVIVLIFFLAVPVNGLIQKKQKKSEVYIKNTILYDFEKITPEEIYQSTKIHGGKYALELNKVNQYGMGLLGSYDTLRNISSIRMSGYIFINDEADAFLTNVVIASLHDSSFYKYEFINIAKLPGLKYKDWNFVSMEYKIPLHPGIKDKFRTNVVYEGNSSIYLDDFKIEFLSGSK